MRNFPSTPCARRWSCDPSPCIPARVRRRAGALVGCCGFGAGVGRFAVCVVTAEGEGNGPGEASPLPAQGDWTPSRRALPRRVPPGEGQARCQSQGWKCSEGSAPLGAGATPADPARRAKLPPSQRRRGFRSESSNTGPDSAPKSLFREAVLLLTLSLNSPTSSGLPWEFDK